MMQENQQRPVLVLGEVLLDVFPDHRRMGGAPFNVAFHLHQLGIPVHFVSRIGQDGSGDEVLEFCRRFDFPVDGIQRDPAKPTGEVRVVTGQKGEHRFDILPERAYDYLSAEPVLDRVTALPPKLIYLGTLAQRHPESAYAIRTIVENFKGHGFVVVDLNLRAPFYDRDVLEFSLRAADALKINDHELGELTLLLKLDEAEDEAVRQLMERFAIKKVALTLGEEGCVLYESGGGSPLDQPAVEACPFVDAVGAGDAFCALWMEGLYSGRESRATLEKAARFAGAVCGLQGALPGDSDFYQAFRDV